MSQHTKRPDSETANLIRQAYEKGDSLTDLAHRYGTTRHHAKECLLALGGQMRAKGDANRVRCTLELNLDELRRLIDEGVLSQREIAQQMKVSLPVIERTLRRLGLRSKRGKGSPMEKNHFWKGGRSNDAQRYILVKCPNHPHANSQGYVREHRLVMEKVLGRYLKPEEVVHHIDRNPRNNDPSNLQLFASNAEHFRAVHKDIWKDQHPKYSQEHSQ